MPITTEHFFLESFLDGDSYSAFADRRRFRTVDNQLNSLVSVIGDGRIDGWTVSVGTFPEMSVLQGGGLIDGFYVNTFGDRSFTLDPSAFYYIYAQRRVGIIGTVGPKSDIASVTYTDLGAPATPTGFTLSATLPFTAELQWTVGSEIDLDHYEIERSTNGLTFELLDDEVSLTGSYTDSSVDEDTTYYYQLYAVDESGNRSSPASDNVTTPLDDTLPPNPIFVEMYASEGAINVLWQRPPGIPFSKIDHWEIDYAELNTDGEAIKATSVTYNVSKTLYYTRINDLTIGQGYRVRIQTVDIKSRSSPGVEQKLTPQPTPAPKDPLSITAVQSAANNGVSVNLSWASGADEYDPLEAFSYRVYVRVNPESESYPISVPLGDTDIDISLYSLDGVNYSSIPEDALVTFRITALSESGFESFGNFTRFVTDNYSVAKSLRNVVATFDFNTGKVIVTWGLNSDTDDITIVVLDDDLEDAYVDFDEIINESIGRTTRYEFTGQLNHRYTIQLTPFNSFGNSGSTSVVAAVGVIPTGLALPVPPEDIEIHSGDKQLSLRWNRSPTLYTSEYHIYRKEGAISFTFSDWQLLDTLPADLTEFTDYGLTNDQIYAYYITAEDIYGRESEHLPDLSINLNFVEGSPKSSGILTEPLNLQASLVGNDIVLTWESLLEEFDTYSIYRSVNNLYNFQILTTLDKNSLTYTDEDVSLIDGYVFYYVIDKSVDDADIIIQTSDIAPENSILLGTIETELAAFGDIDVSDRRDIQDVTDPITEYTTEQLLPHLHEATSFIDPDRIDLNAELIITDWTTIDGRIFFTNELDISGTSYIVKVDGRFPNTFYSVDAINRRLIFAETIVDVEEGVIVGTVPEIEVRVLGVEEVQSALPAFRFDKIHARQIQFGALNKEQLPSFGHDGRIRESMLPRRFLLSRFSNHTFAISEETTDDTKTFGDGTTFFAIDAGDGAVEEVVDFDLQSDGALVAFRAPTYSSTTSSNIESSPNIAEVDSTVGGFQSDKSYHLSFAFVDTEETRWVRITTEDTPISPNPAINLKKRLRFRILLQSGSLYLALGIREITTTPSVGADGGTTGPVEWVGTSETVTDEFDNEAPRGILIEADDDWQEIDIDLKNAAVVAFENGNSILSEDYGVLEHLAFTINPDDSSPLGPFDIYIDEIQQVTDVLVAGTSQGIQLSEDFGNTWSLVRYTDTPIHKFYRASNNKYLWAISATQVLLATDPANWFATAGTVGVQYVRDIVEDSLGNMYISTDKGVFWLEIALIQSFSTWRQTQPINAFSSDCYGMFVENVSSGVDDIFVSTEIGIYKTSDKGTTWTDSGLRTAGLIAYDFQDINSNPADPNWIAITRKHVLRKYNSDTDFNVIANLEDQFNVSDTWEFAYFDECLYVSTGSGVYRSCDGVFFDSSPISATFVRVFADLDTNRVPRIAFGLDVVEIQDSGLQLFISQENRLMVATQAGSLSIRKQYLNKELPSFFIDDEEINIGYIYNHFNGVLVFREPQDVNKYMSAAHLPRLVYIPVNGGWAQTNPTTDVFIYVNGFPRWLDFTDDEPIIVGEIQVLQGKLGNTSELTTFNSLLPQSQTFLEATQADVTSILSGADDGSPLITNDTIVQFLDDYTRLLSLVLEDYVTTNNLTFPVIQFRGIARSDREEGSRAELFEAQQNFEAFDSTGILIDVRTGKVDFRESFANATTAEEQVRFTFTKWDHLNITIFNANVKTTGELAHRNLEDDMEDVNSGLSSDLTGVNSSNFLKLGLFLEGRNPGIFSTYPVESIQSRFYPATASSWYDIISSSVD